MHIAERTSQRLIATRDQRGPQWRYGAGSADHGVLTVDAHLVAAFRIRIACNVRDAAATFTARQRDATLPIGLGHLCADATAGGAIVRGCFIPDGFAFYRAATGLQASATASEHVLAGCGKIDVRLVVVFAVARTIVAGCGNHRHAHGHGVFERALHRVKGLGTPTVLGATPADRHDRWLVGRVVCGFRNGFGENLGPIW